ncbi:hypothetical protein M422DRAFT_257642 [Sphaerobolus stellatus SS14]|uniref:Uncharacterized protein n=1 Tax=Sphaerobolus stellatus (strain SS14) TaxID=990650 RepID=A0A0C9VDU8_SPHS4|nr:hypothetical protein M422DRAFT_257642 [Sphaerobolus stellatus SS14]
MTICAYTLHQTTIVSNQTSHSPATGFDERAEDPDYIPEPDLEDNVTFEVDSAGGTEQNWVFSLQENEVETQEVLDDSSSEDENVEVLGEKRKAREEKVDYLDVCTETAAVVAQEFWADKLISDAMVQKKVKLPTQAQATFSGCEQSSTFAKKKVLKDAAKGCTPLTVFVQTKTQQIQCDIHAPTPQLAPIPGSQPLPLKLEEDLVVETPQYISQIVQNPGVESQPKLIISEKVIPTQSQTDNGAPISVSQGEALEWLNPSIDEEDDPATSVMALVDKLIASAKWFKTFSALVHLHCKG